MEDSLKKLKSFFPWFFDKTETSNFHKSQYVTNRRFQRLDNDLFKIYQSFHLDKKLLIWKDQVEPYVYNINFVARFDKLKTVTCYKDDKVIYTESFEYDDLVDTFEYTYKGNTLNDVTDISLADIIPQYKFKIIVETYDEYYLVKGWPENDTLEGNEYDHDISLDRIGESNNIPRKKYLIVNPEFYSATEPPYNDRASEDDYHYMKRQIEYNLRLHDTPAPVLEIWKLYGIDAVMENREKLLLKVFDLERHPNFIDENAPGDGWFSGTLNEETEEIIPWSPQKWEHQDQFCDYQDNLGKYFFVKISTNIPVKNQNVIFYFKFMNSLAQELPGEHTVEIWLNNQLIVSTTDSQYTLTSDQIPQDRENLFIIRGKDSHGELIGSEEILISVRGCNSADYYVSPSGSDNNDGKTRNTAFKTIQKAVNTVNGDKNLIAILTGTYTITSPITLNQPCILMGCGSVLIENTSEDLFFRLPSNTNLTLQDLTLQYRGDVCNVTDTSFTNNNGNNSYADIIILFTNAPIVVMTLLNLTSTSSNFIYGSTVNLTATLKDKYGDALEGATITLTGDGVTHTQTTNSSGIASDTFTPTTHKDLIVNASFAGAEGYKPSNASITIPILIRISELLSDYDYVVIDMEYVDDEWHFTKLPVSEITTLGDLNGAIMNLTYNSDRSVTFTRFSSYSTSTALNKTQINSLKGLLVGLAYDDYTVEYTEIEILKSTQLTLSADASVTVGDTITFTGKLTDKYDENVTNAIVTVNNTNYSTDNNGEFTGTITATNPGTLTLTANYNGDLEHTASTTSTNVEVLIDLASVLDDYDYVVMDMEYTGHDWTYVTKPVEEIEVLSDLNNAIMNLNKYNDTILYDRFSSTSTESSITKSERESLTGLLVGLLYDDYKVKYTKLQ